MRNRIEQFLNNEINSIKNKNLKSEHFNMTKNIRGNRIDFQFFNPQNNERFAYFSVYFDGASVKLQKNFSFGNIYQQNIFELFISSINSLIISSTKTIIKTLNRNKIFA